MLAIRVHEFGDADKLFLEEMPIPEPEDGQSLIRLHYAGINYTEIYQRSGVTKVKLPFTLGSEGVGEIARSERFPKGLRVAWVGYPGSYAEYAIVPDEKLVPIPDDITSEVAATVLLQGITAQYLAEASYLAKSGDIALVHAAAGGVGLLLTQLLVSKGVTVIGTTSSDAKANVARNAGAKEIIRYDCENVGARLRQAYPEGAHVVYDSVGRDTWEGSLAALRRRGTFVLYGHASGKVPPIDPMVLAQRGSLSLTRPLIGDFIATSDELQTRVDRLFDCLRDGTLRPLAVQTYTLDEVHQAHRDLESRQTTGKLVVRIAG